MKGYQQLLAAMASILSCHCTTGVSLIGEVHRLCNEDGKLKGTSWIKEGKNDFTIFCALGGRTTSEGTKLVKRVPFKLTEEEYIPYAMKLYVKMDFYWENKQ